MRVGIATDHGGFGLKEEFVAGGDEEEATLRAVL